VQYRRVEEKLGLPAFLGTVLSTRTLGVQCRGVEERRCAKVGIPGFLGTDLTTLLQKGRYEPTRRNLIAERRPTETWLGNCLSIQTVRPGARR
jgi:hypothetical protein